MDRLKPYRDIPRFLINSRGGSVADWEFLRCKATVAVALLLLAFGGRAAEADDSQEAPITSSDRQHWAFQPIASPEVPSVRDGSWCRTDIDRFILAALEEKDLRPMPEADRLTLLRRVTFDLTGLPPTVGEIEAFLADQGPQAYERVVERLLGSAAYGERWAQHWLDLARFAETDGFEHDHVRPNAWRYRDWVIGALNADMPYDEFIRQQLAGDERYPGDPDAAVATGFLLCGPDMPDINLKTERRHNFLNDMTGTVGAVLMGMQMACAACHDHKYDPISQRDFYRLRSFFEPMDLFREQEIPTARERRAREQFQVERARKWKALEAEIARLKTEEPENTADLEALQEELKDLKRQEGPPVTMGRVVRERGRRPDASYLWVRGDFRRRGPELQPVFLRVANLAEAKVPPPAKDAASSGRRTALADWLTDPKNPLTARVIVNRLWMHHFGAGIVGTPSDFGLMGYWPTHPRLLDWLASELIRRDWSLKQLHRLMVTSSVYRVSSRPGADPELWAALVDADADNDLRGRMRRQRLEGETIRDAMLSAAGRLNRKPGGPGVRPPLPQEVVVTLLKNQWPVTEDPAEHDRRSIYLFVRRNLTYPLFDVFDRPDTNLSCPERNETTIAPQALHLLNSEFSLTCARSLAELLQRECGDDVSRQITRATQRILGRPPEKDERRLLADFLTGADPETGLTDLCLALFNANEFVYVD